MTPQYTASSTIEISREADKVTDLQGVEREAGIADQEFYQTQYGLLESRALSERVATQLKLTERSEEHTSELQSLMRISYAVFCLKKTKTNISDPANTSSNHEHL